MTAVIRHLFRHAAAPTPPPVAIRCPHCGVRGALMAPATPTDEATTLLGIRRIRACIACGRSFATLEQVEARCHDAVLAIPVGTPRSVQRALEWIARAVVRVGGGR
jgi:transcriptional regulator NrdR family protein